MLIKLVKGISYFYNGQTFNNDVPVVVDNATAEHLISTGHFVKVDDVTDDVAETVEGETTLPDLAKMSVSDLKALAKQLNVDVKSNAKKGDLIVAISEAQSENTSDDDVTDDFTATDEDEE